MSEFLEAKMERNCLTQMPSYRCRSETDGMRISSETDGWDERAVDSLRARCKQQTAGSSSRTRCQGAAAAAGEDARRRAHKQGKGR